MTEAEKALWKNLRYKQFMGLKFLNQHPLFYKIDGYKNFFIADFYCHQLRLVIEVDGGIHETQQEYDAVLSRLLASKEIWIIRIKNEEILEKINRALINLKDQINNFKEISLLYQVTIPEIGRGKKTQDNNPCNL